MLAITKERTANNLIGLSVSLSIMQKQRFLKICIGFIIFYYSSHPINMTTENLLSKSLWPLVTPRFMFLLVLSSLLYLYQDYSQYFLNSV